METLTIPSGSLSGVWVRQSDHLAAVEKVQQDIELETLAQVYALGGFAAVGELCDEKLDRSGGLLGRVRDRVEKIRSAQPGGDGTRMAPGSAEPREGTAEGGK